MRAAFTGGLFSARDAGCDYDALTTTFLATTQPGMNP
jgi:hypothetical protein